MSFDLQTAIVLLFVLIAGAYLTRLAIRTWRGKSSGCTGCSKASAPAPKAKDKPSEQKV